MPAKNTAAAQPDTPFLILGLGNPGQQYIGTRHNIGRMTIDELCSLAFPMPATLGMHKKTQSHIAETRLRDSSGTEHRVILAVPNVFMNLSGGPVKALQRFFKVPAEQIIVLFDDLELDFGSIKLRRGGGDHGHNGLRSITKSLGTKDYIRAGIGIGRPPGRMEPTSFVLKPFSRAERESLPIICADAADEVQKLLARYPTAE